MQAAEAQKGLSTKSQLVDSLKGYLNNPNRLQPIIGLGSIIECVKAGTHNREVLYLCEVCVCRLGKADMRNHIMGSLHRFNYIKAWHPHLVSEWKEKSDLSKLAWPLMEMAKILEGKEGPGDVQWLEVEDAVYQKMATHSENDAVTLITILRDGLGERESLSETVSVQLEHYHIQSQRIVLLPQNPDTLKTSAETNKTVAFIKSEDCLKNKSPEPSALSDYGFLDGYTGSKPLVGLFRMVECRSEDGHTYCFLCHCCRIRSNKKDIIDHLTRSSHIVNYLMETYPEQVEAMMADTDDSYQLLQSLAKKVEREEGRGEPKVVNAPESLCILMTGKSYHWCLKMLHSGGWTDTKNQKWKKAVKGPSVNKTSNQGMPEKRAMMSRRAKRRTAKRKLRGVTNTVFKVSLPLTKGSVLLERTSVSTDSLYVTSEYSPSPDLDHSTLPQSLSEDCELDYDTGSFAVNHAEHTSQLQQDVHGGHEDTCQYMEPERNVTVTQYQEVDDCSSDNKYFHQSEDRTGTKYHKMYGDDYYNRQHGSQESSSKSFYEEWQTEGSQTDNEWLSPAASHTDNWPPYNSSYGREAGCTEQWYNSASQSKAGTREEKQSKMSLYTTQQYYQQQPQYHYMAQDHTSLQQGSEGQHGLSHELAARSDPARIYMHHRAGDSLVHSGSIAPEPRERFLDSEQRQLQTYMEFTTGPVQTAQQSYMIQSTAHQAIQYGVMSNPSYNIGPRTNSDQHVPHPLNSDGGGGGGMSQSNAFIPPGQALCYAAHSDLNFRATGFSDLMTSGGTTPFMFEYPKC